MRASLTFRLFSIIITFFLVLACEKDAITYQLNCHITDSSAAAALAGATATVKVFIQLVQDRIQKRLILLTILEILNWQSNEKKLRK